MTEALTLEAIKAINETILGTGLNTHNLPLKSGKGSAYEGGPRVPLIMAWASANKQLPHQQMLDIEQGSVLHNPVFGDDITESRNLIRRNQAVASDLYGKMTEWMRRVDAQLPVSKETGLPVSFPEWNFRE